MLIGGGKTEIPTQSGVQCFGGTTQPHRKPGRVFRAEWPGRFLWRICRKMLFPIISAEVFFVFDTSLGDPVTAVCPAGIQVHVYQGLESFETVEAHIASMGMRRTVKARLGRGEAVVIATDGIRAVGFSWVAFSDFWAEDFKMRVAIPPLYICHSDVFVRPEWRGRGINALMAKVAKGFARDQGRERAVSWINALNWPSLRVTQRWQSLRVMTLVCLRIRGTKRTWHAAFGKPLDLFFRNL